MRIDRRALALALGALLGIATAAADGLSGGYPPNEAARAASVILNAGSTWAALAVLAGWLVRGSVAGSIAGVAALLLAVLGYYGWGVLAGDRTAIGFSGVAGALRMWAVAAVVAGPVLGLAGATIRRGGWAGLLAGLVVPVGVLVEMLGIRGLGGDSFRIDPVLGFAQAAMVAAAVVAGCAVALGFATRGATPSRA
jgi:hypothetical protein